jgi:nicotinamide mononucleotide adenylyltransferase
VVGPVVVGVIQVLHRIHLRMIQEAVMIQVRQIVVLHLAINLTNHANPIKNRMTPSETYYAAIKRLKKKHGAKYVPTASEIVKEEEVVLKLTEIKKR